MTTLKGELHMKKNPIMIVHLILMLLMALGTIGGAVNFIIGAVGSATVKETFSNLTNILLMAVILSTILMGALYLLKGYGKQSAVYYKLFLLLNVGVCALTIFIDLYFYQVNTLMIAICVLNAIKLVDLLILTFAKDLGSRTWILFYVILGLDVAQLILAVINMTGIGFDFSFTGYVTALVMDGTIGLAIRGKYRDKMARGR